MFCVISVIQVRFPVRVSKALDEGRGERPDDRWPAVPWLLYFTALSPTLGPKHLNMPACATASACALHPCILLRLLDTFHNHACQFYTATP